MKKIFRIFRLFKLKIYRIRDFPEAVAIGLSWGAAVSFTPLLGFHLIICYLGTWLMRGNLIAATVGTIIGNPWTFPIFFYVDYKIGLLFFEEKLNNYEFKVQFFINNFEASFLPNTFRFIAYCFYNLVYYILHY